VGKVFRQLSGDEVLLSSFMELANKNQKKIREARLIRLLPGAFITVATVLAYF
jgi:predicted nucleic acid-binding Zn ribbon protein